MLKLMYRMLANTSLDLKASPGLVSTNDKVIRTSLRIYLSKLHARDSKLRIVEEFGVEHGAARVDVAVINGILHGYDMDTR